MPPSSRHHRFRSAHDIFVRYYTRHDETTFNVDSAIDQPSIALPPDPNIVARKQTIPSHNSATIVALVILLVISTLVIIGALLFLIHHCQNLNNSKLTPSQTVTSHDGGDTVVVEKRRFFPKWIRWMKKYDDNGVRFILHQGEGGVVISKTPPSSLKGILMSPRQYSAHDIDEKGILDEEHQYTYRIPSMAFDRMSPSVRAPLPSANRSLQFTQDDSRDYIINEGINILVSEDLSSSSSSDSEYANASRRSDFTIAEYQRSLQFSSSTSDTEESSGPVTPNRYLFDPQVQISSQDALIAETQSREFFSKLRGLIPKPPSARLSTNIMRRSSTAPAFFTIVSPNNKRASIASLKPGSSRERESVTSNFLLRLIEGHAKNERSLLEEAFPPPAIIVSPPTTSTITSGIDGHGSLGTEGDVWYQAYRMHIAGDDKAVGAPPKYNAELSKKRGSVDAPPRPARSPRRTSMQALADGTELS